MKKYSITPNIKTQTGFSLVDILVGMVIALLGVIIIFQVFAVSEGIKRTTTSGGDAIQNGAYALYTLERSLKSAGYGIFFSTNLATVQPDPPALSVPVTIMPSGSATISDSLVLHYRQGWDYGPFPPDPTSFASIVPPAVTTETLSVNANAQLISTVSGVGTVISDGIVLMKAEYGVDLNGNGWIDPNEWNQAVPPSTFSVLAVRLAVVTRSAQPEKPSAGGGACDTTTTYPTWVDSASIPLDISAGLGLFTPGDSWKCYRYKTFENTVPLRNVMWRP